MHSLIYTIHKSTENEIRMMNMVLCFCAFVLSKSKKQDKEKEWKSLLHVIYLCAVDCLLFGYLFFLQILTFYGHKVRIIFISPFVYHLKSSLLAISSLASVLSLFFSHILCLLFIALNYRLWLMVFLILLTFISSASFMFPDIYIPY